MNSTLPRILAMHNLKYLIFVIFLFTACSNGETSWKNIKARAFPLGENQFAISTRDGKVSLCVTDSKVYMQLSKKMLKKLNHKLDSNTESDHHGLAGEISRFVKTHVKELLNHKITYHLSDIRSVSYKNGGLVFAYRHKHFFSFDKVEDQNKPVLKCFNKNDALAFIARLKWANEHNKN